MKQVNHEVKNQFRVASQGLAIRDEIMLKNVLHSAPLNSHFQYLKAEEFNEADLLFVNVEVESVDAVKAKVANKQASKIIEVSSLISGNTDNKIEYPIIKTDVVAVLLRFLDEQTPVIPEKSSAIHALVVDDSKQAREYISVILEEYFGEGEVVIRQSDNGADAIKICTSESFDIIFIDVEMPGLNGYETCEEIKKISDARLVMLTSRSSAKDVQQSKESGARNFLIKPPDQQILSSILYLVKIKKGDSL